MTEPLQTVPAPPPAWLRWFINDASKGILDCGTVAPVGCHHYFDEESGVWEISLFVSDTEVVGGPCDGKMISSGLQVDVLKVIEAFDSRPEIYWQSEAVEEDDQLGNHLSFEGPARGNHVWLRILHQAPRWAGPGRLLHAARGIVEELW